MERFHQYPVWRKKGFKYWFKYCARNWPEALLSIPVFGIILPTILAYKAYRNSDEEYSKMSTRFKTEYVVIRHDDPRVKLVYKSKPEDYLHGLY